MGSKCQMFAVLAAMALGGAQVLAGFTPINSPPLGEDTHQAIFSAVYGGSFVQNGLDYSNGAITAYRVEDFTDANFDLSDIQSLVPENAQGVLNADDQLWQADFQLASAEAKFAAFQQRFGYYDGLADTTYHELFEQTGYAYDVAGSADITALAGKTIRWARGGEDRIVSSRPMDNADLQDHMVTYLIVDQNQNPPEQTPTVGRGASPRTLTWLLFWEDKFLGEQLADFDFNDLVVEITAAESEIVPEPASGAFLLAGLLLARQRRR